MPNTKSKTEDLSGAIREAGFKMPLPTEIEGADASGGDFREKTVLSYISHRGASFWITNHVAVGTELRLTVALPKKLATDKNLHLIIRGSVIFVETVDEEAERHRVSIRFKNQYIIEDKD